MGKQPWSLQREERAGRGDLKQQAGGLKQPYLARPLPLLSRDHRTSPFLLVAHLTLKTLCKHQAPTAAGSGVRLSACPEGTALELSNDPSWDTVRLRNTPGSGILNPLASALDLGAVVRMAP